MDRSRFIRSIVFFLIVFGCTSANAQTVEFTLHVDNNGPQSGCEVNLANVGTTLGGIDTQVTATIDRPSKTIIGLNIAKCGLGSFGNSVALAAGIPLGLNNGVDGSDVIEIPVSMDSLWRPPQVLNLYFSITNPDSGAQDLAGVSGTGQTAVATWFSVPYAIPAVGFIGLIITAVLLLCVGLLVLQRKRYTLAVSLLAVSSICFAINFVADGLVGDWAGVGISTSDAVGDSSPPDPTADIRSVYLALESGTFFVRIDVTDLENVAPEATAGNATVQEDGTVNITLAGSDADGDALTFAIASPPASGSLGAITPIDAGSAAVVYTPDPDFNGLDSFTFKSNDSISDSLPASIDVTVTAVNDEPRFTAGANQVTNEDSGAQSVSGWATGISPGPADESGQVISFNVGNDNNALFSVQPNINSAGDLAYTPADGANGAALVTLDVMDDGGTANGGDDTSSTQTFTITVNGVNDEPEFTAGTDQSVLEDAGAQTVTNWATGISAGPPDEAGQVISFSLSNDNNALFSAQPGVNSAGDLSYTPADDANGVASVTIVLMDDGGTANGGDDTSAPQTFTITVSPVNDEPQFTAGADQVVNEDAGAQSVASWATGISSGPADESGQVISFNVGNDNNALFSIQPIINSAGDLAYTPADDANGAALVTLDVMDDGGTADGGDDTSATQTFTITVNAVNDEPTMTVGPDRSVNEDSGPQTFSDGAIVDSVGPADEAGQTASFNTSNNNNALFTSQPVVSTAGVLSFTTADDAHGSALVSIEAMDNGGTANGGDDTSVSGSFVIEVVSVNDVPAFTAGADQSVDQDSGAQTVSNWATGISTGPVNESGQVVSFNIGNDNNALFSAQPAVDTTGTLSYTPANGAFGSANVTIAIMDDGGTANGGDDESDPQTFVITVIAANIPPVLDAIGDQSIDELKQLSFTATATNPDVPAQTLTYSLSGAPTGASITTGGAFTWTPTEAQGAPGAAGMYTFDVNVIDNGVPAYSDSETITVTANEVNQPPLAVDDNYNATGNTGINVNSASGLITGDSDADLPLQPLMFTAETVASAQGGSATILSDGSFTYTPPAGYTGDDTFSYTVNDNMAGSDSGSVTVSVDDMIWYVDNTAPTGNGTLAAPFNSLAAFEAVNGNGGATDPGANDCIFIENAAGAITYDGPVTLEDGQILVGAGASGTIPAECGITLADNSASLPSTGGTRPVINSTTEGISLAMNNILRGFDVGTTSSYGIAGTTVGSPQISLVSILGAGPALGISASGNMDGVSFDVLQCSSTGALPCLNLTGVNGTLGITSGGSGLIQTGTGHAVAINGGALNLTYPAAISKTTNANSTITVVNGHTGSLTFSSTVLASSGDGLQFSDADGAYTFANSVTLNGGDAGIDILSGSGGTFTFQSSGSVITNPSGVALRVENSAASVTYPGSITKTNNAQSMVSVTSNTGTITLEGSLAASTLTANAFVAKNGGTINVTNNNNTVVTTTGTGIEIDDTTIGSGGVTFRSVSVNGANKGIVLNNAGTGGFTITGGGAVSGSGGTIQNVFGRGIDITSTDNINLGYMALTNTAQNDAGSNCSGLVNSACAAAIHLNTVANVVLDNLNINGSKQIGINGLDVSNLTLSNSQVSNAGDEVNEGVLQFFGLTGTSSITDSTFSFPSERVAYVRNASGTLDLTISGSIFSDSQTSVFGADGLEVYGYGTAVIDLTIDTASEFLRNRTNGLQVLADGNSAVAVFSSGSTFDRDTGIGLGVDMSATGSASLDFDVTDSPLINGRNASAFNSFVADSAVIRGRLDNSIDMQVGGGLTSGLGVRLNLNGTASAVYDVSNNTISNIGADVGIQALARGGTGRMDATINGNSVAVHATPLNSLYNIWVHAQDNNSVCANVTNNANTGIPIAAFRERTVDAGSTVFLEGFNTDAITTWNNNGNTPLGSVDSSNNGTLASGTCVTVPLSGFPID